MSKLRIAWKCLTGGVDGIWELALEYGNGYLMKLPAEKLKRYAGLVSQLAAMVKSAADALADRKLDKCEVDALAAEGRALCAAWREEGEDED